MRPYDGHVDMMKESKGNPGHTMSSKFAHSTVTPVLELNIQNRNYNKCTGKSSELTNKLLVNIGCEFFHPHFYNLLHVANTLPKERNTLVSLLVLR